MEVSLDVSAGRFKVVANVMHSRLTTSVGDVTMGVAAVTLACCAISLDAVLYADFPVKGSL